MPNNDNNIQQNAIELPYIQTLNLLYTNDIKGEAQQMAYLATVVKQIRAAEPFILLVDSGNWSKGTLLSDKFKGMPMVEIMNELQYDAAGLGDGEFSFGSQNLYALEGEAKFPFLCCNLIETGTGIPPYFLEKRFHIVEKGPFKTAITGITYPEEYPEAGLAGKDPFTILPAVLEEIKEESPDVIILLSRMGLERDKAIARAFPSLNVIVGGGDGISMAEPHKEGNVFIVQAGEKAETLGSLAIDMETTIKITSSEEK